MRELRAITEALRDVFDDARLRRDLHAGARVRVGPGARRLADARPAYRLFDEHGAVLALRSDMTVPIARVVATRYAERRAAAALLLLRPRLPRRAPAARPAARVPAGGHRADRLAAPRRGRPRRSTCCARALDAVGPARLPRRAGRRRRCSRRCWTTPASPEERGAARRCTSWPTRDFVGLERELAARWASTTRRGERCCCACPQLRGGVEVLGRPRGRGRARSTGMRARARAAGAARWPSGVIFDLGLLARPRLLHRRGLRGLRPGAGRAARRRRALRRAARALRAAAARAVGFALTSSGCTSALAGEERRSAMSGADDRGPARRAVRGHARPARRPRGSTRREVRIERPQAALRGRRARHDAPVRRARPTSRRARPTSGSRARTC